MVRLTREDFGYKYKNYFISKASTPGNSTYWILSEVFSDNTKADIRSFCTLKELREYLDEESNG